MKDPGFFVAIVIAFVLGVVFGFAVGDVKGELRASTRVQNEAVLRGYGKLILTDLNERGFIWIEPAPQVVAPK